MSSGKPLPRRSRRGHLNSIFTLFLPLVCAVLSCSVQVCEPARLFCPWGFSRLEYWSGLLCPPPGDLPDPGIEPRSPALQTDSLPSEPLGKPMNTGMGNVSLLQGIFPIQESNLSLLHCRWIFYQLSYQGSSNFCYF